MTWLWILLGLSIYWWLGHRGCRYLKALSLRRDWNGNGGWDGGDEMFVAVLWFFFGGLVWIWSQFHSYFVESERRWFD